MNFSLTQATDSDFPFLLDLRLKTMQAHLEAQGIFLTQPEHRERVAFKYPLAQIILIDNQQAGLLKLEESESALDIHQFQLLPQFQGMGYGRKILNQVIHRAGLKPVNLSVLKKNPAYRLYLSAGFIQVGEDQHEYHLTYQQTNQ